MNSSLSTYMQRMPLIAILRGVTPDEVLEIVDCLHEAGICIVEVPLNSPEALRSVQLLSQRYSDEILIGAGTVISTEQVAAVAAAGGRIIVSPNMDLTVIRATKERGLISAPGVATPSEAFAAIDAGADALKAFPAEMITPSVIKSWRAVLPKDVPLVPVGGIDSTNMLAYWQAGANGFGLGGSLYRAGKPLEEIQASAQSIVRAFTQCL